MKTLQNPRVKDRLVILKMLFPKRNYLNLYCCLKGQI